MKKLSIFFPPLSILLLSLTFNSCLKDQCSNTYTFTRWTPVYKTDAQINEQPKYEPSRPMKHPGKIYFYDKYVLINEQKEGVHVIDNSNPSAPLKLGFISIPGNVDIAIKGNIMYADNYMNLLALDVSNLTQPKIVKRTEGVFQASYWRDGNNGWLVDYNPEEITETIDCTDPRIAGINNVGWTRRGLEVITVSGSSFDAKGAFGSQSSGAVPAGVGGSLARFTINTNYLYTVDRSSLKTFNINQLDNPILMNTNQVGWNIETIYPYKNNLFIGSTTGMFIYDLVNPAAPTQASVFSHARACDPVVVENDIAYVTLRSGTACNWSINQLDIIDVKDIRNPKLLKTYQMTNPRGLSVLDSKLYLCDDGLKIYDATEWDKLDSNLKAQLKGFDANDIIAYTNQSRSKTIGMVIGKNGLYQFDLSNPKDPKQLSVISVDK